MIRIKTWDMQMICRIHIAVWLILPIILRFDCNLLNLLFPLAYYFAFPIVDFFGIIAFWLVIYCYFYASAALILTNQLLTLFADNLP